MSTKQAIEVSLDEVLIFLKKDFYSHHIDYMELQSNMSANVRSPYGLLPLIERLATEEYVDRIFGGTTTSSYGGVKITLKGIQFIESGGYQNELISNVKRDLRNRAIYIWSIIAGVAAIISVLVSIFALIHH